MAVLGIPDPALFVQPLGYQPSTLPPGAYPPGSVGAGATGATGSAVYLPFRSGFYYTGPYLQKAGQSISVGTMHAIPIYIGQSTIFDQIAVRTSGISAGAVVRLGIYADGGGKPTTLLNDYGTVAAASVGDSIISISATMVPGMYWLACAGQTAAPSLLCNSGQFSVGFIGMSGPLNNNAIMGYTQTGVTGALPSPWGATLTETQIPILTYLRAA